jgi:hypothetical protein
MNGIDLCPGYQFFGAPPDLQRLCPGGFNPLILKQGRYHISMKGLPVSR